MIFNSEYDKSMLAFMKECRESTGNRDVWRFFGVAKSRDSFYEDVDRLASFLMNIGVGRGKSVAICLPNIPDAVVATYAVNKVGAVANIIHPLIPSDGLEHIVERVGSSVLFIFDLLYEQHRTVIDALGIPTIVCSVRDYVSPIMRPILSIAMHSKTKGIRYGENIISYRDAMRTDIVDIEDDIRGEDVAIYLHSGGTTGEPKTVMLSNRSLNALADKTRDLVGGTMTEDDSMLMVLPLFHGFGLGVCMHTILCASSRMVLMPSFDPKKAIRLIKKEHITYIAGVPTMYDKMMNEPTFVGEHLKGLKQCYCGGDKLTEPTKKRFDAIMHEAGASVTLSEGYGLTEVVTVCSVNCGEDSRFPSVGRPLKGVELKIIDENGETLPAHELGEICVSADSMMTGYYGDEETTRRVMQEDESGKTWIHTGDIGYLDADGYLFFKDRLKRMVKISGMNVFPKEIETIAERVPHVKIAAAIPSTLNAKPIVKLLVVLEDGYTFDESMERCIRDSIASELMKYSVPKVIEARESLPLTIVGKVDYKVLEREERA